ncbi:uncharacterized protein LOC125769601 isoform X4 [Anopheles funestus]
MSEFVKQLRQSNKLYRRIAVRQSRFQMQEENRLSSQSTTAATSSIVEIANEGQAPEHHLNVVPDVNTCISVVFDEGDAPVPDDSSAEEDDDSGSLEQPENYSEENFSLSSDANQLNELPFHSRLKHLVLSTNLTHDTTNKLMALLRDTTNFQLPKDARTLLRTPQNIGSQIVPISGGDFWYQGIEKALQCYFRNFNSEINTIEVTLSMDGLPLHTSGTTCFWPILMRVEGIPQAAIRVVAIFCGYSKPENAEEYLRPLVNELNHLHRNGITLNSITRPFKLRCIIGDAPARALIKGKENIVCARIDCMTDCLL